MLTKELAITEYDFERGRIIPDRLTQSAHARYVQYARGMLLVYRNGTGRTRRELHREVHNIFAREEDCPARRIDAFCKLLDDASQFQRDRHGKAAKLRQQVFQMAAERHPLVQKADGLFETEEREVKQQIAERLDRSWEEIERELFADVIEFHRLEKFAGFAEPKDLLARYNVAQVQAALYGAVKLTVWARRDFKTVLRYAKLARLMHSIDRQSDGRYRIRFDGPASVLRGTRRYGVRMAQFLPALLACDDWRLHAVVRSRRGWELALDLCDKDGLHSHQPSPDEFDSQVEEAFAKRWGNEPRDGWRIDREGEVLHEGQKVFVPDFAFHHEDGRTVLLEIIGFWTPEYLQAKAETLEMFQSKPILLAVAEENREKMPGLPTDPIWFKTRLRVEDVLEKLQIASLPQTLPNETTAGPGS